MGSPAQNRANRANSARSTGPKTEQGRATSSANSLQHGLTAQQIVIGDEEGDQFHALIADLTSSHKPANPAEIILVGQIAENYWRLMRARRVETGNWDKILRENYRVTALPGNERFIPGSEEERLANIFRINEN